jgi:hypothetical protein
MTEALERGREPRTRLGTPPDIRRRQGNLGYIVTRYEHSCPELFCVPLESGEEALVAFSSGMTTQDFISSYALDPEWHARSFSASELISLLVGPCTHIDWVIVDPFPGCLKTEGVPTNLVHWQRFVDHLLG